VFYLGEAPAYVDAEKSVDAEKVFSAFTGISLADLPAALECVREISLLVDGKEVDPLLSLIRRSENFQTVFICNVGHELGKYHQEREPGVLERTACFPEVQVKLRSVCPGNLYELDLDSGDFYRVESVVNDGVRSFVTSFDQLGSRLFIECMDSLPVVTRPPQAADKLVMELDGLWDFQANANTLVLDNAEYMCEGRMLFLTVLEAIRNDQFKTDQQSFDPKNQVEFIAGKFPQGPRMIALGGIADMLNAFPGEKLWQDYADEFIRFIFRYHVNTGCYKELQEFFCFLYPLCANKRI
jgi:hypothetical protein